MAQLNDLLVLGKSTFKGAMRINNRVTSYHAEGPRFIANDGTNTVWFGINTDGNAWGIYDVVNSKFIISDNGTKTTVNNPFNATAGIGIANTEGAGMGISLYNGSTGANAPAYGIMFAKTANFGTHGGVT